jgi:hypothetical protein
MSYQNEIARKARKAERYAKEAERLRFQEFIIKFAGDHHTYTLILKGGELTCSCPFFSKHKLCSHTMAIKKILSGML